MGPHHREQVGDRDGGNEHDGTPGSGPLPLPTGQAEHRPPTPSCARSAASTGSAACSCSAPRPANELRDDSDIDLLVEFEPGRTPGLLGVAKLELELQGLLGREVDLRTAGDLSPYLRDDVVAAARVLHDAA
jgi:uncharacterized protein